MGILTDEMQRMVRHQRLGYVATVSAEQRPNVSPKGSLTIWDDSHLVFADIESPHTIKNLGTNPHVEVNVVDPFTRKGFRFRGPATVLRSGDAYWKAVELYRTEGADVRRIRAIVMITVEQVLPLVSPVYSQELTEEDVRRLWEEYHTKRSQKTVLDLVPPSDF